MIGLIAIGHQRPPGPGAKRKDGENKTGAFKMAATISENATSQHQTVGVDGTGVGCVLPPDLPYSENNVSHVSGCIREAVGPMRVYGHPARLSPTEMYFHGKIDLRIGLI